MVSSALPPRERINMEIKRITIETDHAEVHGYAGSGSEKDQVQKALAKDCSASALPSEPRN